MKRSASYWNSDDEDDGPRTYRNVRPARAGIQRAGGHNLLSAMQQDYAHSRQKMTRLDAQIQDILQGVDKLDQKIQWYTSVVSRFPDERLYEDIDILKYNKKHNLRKVNQLRRQWSFYANNYHRYEDVGAQTSYAYDAYMTHAMSQQ